MLPSEVPATLKLYLDGKIEQFWYGEDKLGVIFLMNVDSVEHAKATVEALPFVKDELRAVRVDARRPSRPPARYPGSRQVSGGDVHETRHPRRWSYRAKSKETTTNSAARHRRMSTSAESGAPELELYGAKTGNCLRAAIGLSEAGIPYNIRHVDLPRGEQRDASHIALNRAGKVPVLVARGYRKAQAFVHTQSSAILFYTEAAASGLPPYGDSVRIRTLETFFYFTTDVIPLNSAAFSLPEPQFSNAAAALTERDHSAMSASERFLIGNEFIGGAGFSIADIAAFTIVSAVNRHGPESASSPGRLARSHPPWASCSSRDHRVRR
jgi:GSH-dependent disulfide-bond oxidoreductase